MVAIRHNSGRKWVFAYDLDKGETIVRDVYDREERWTWDDAGRLTCVRLANGGAKHFEYEQRGLISKEIEADGGVFTYKWHHALPLMLEESNPSGNSTAWEYDDRGKLVRITDAVGGRTEFINDEYGQVVAATDPNGGEYGFSWNAMGLLTREVDCSGKVSTYSYDADGNPLEFRDALGQSTRMRHDAIGRLLAVKLPDAGTRAYTWDDAGRLIQSVDGEGHTTRLRYTLHDELAESVNPMSQATSYEYDRIGNLCGLTNENGESYTFGHDAARRLVRQSGLDGTESRYELDCLGLPVSVTQGVDTRLETTTRLDRDLLGRLVRKSTAESITEYAYDPLGRITDIIRTDREGNALDAIHFGYDPLGNLIEEKTVARGKVQLLQHAYDPLGNRVSTRLPDGRVINHMYCGSGFLHQISTAAQQNGLERVISAFERDDLHRETLRTQGRRHALSKYDPLSRLTRRGSAMRRDQLEMATPETVIPEIIKEFAYDRNGEMVRRKDSFDGTRDYRYDAAGRIVSSSGARDILQRHERELAATALFVDERFTYDAAGNMLATGTDDGRIPAGVVSDFSPASRRDRKGQPHVMHNRLRELGTFRYAYDVLGRTTQKEDADNNIIWNYKYNCENQLIEVAVRSRSGGFRRISYEYDALGRRVGKSDGKQETRFVWDGMLLLQEISAKRISTYVYEQDSYVPLARLDAQNPDWYPANNLLAPPAVEPDIYYFQCNASGMPEEMSDADGNIVWRARYSAWGKVLFENTTKHAPKDFEQNLRMQGQYDDRECGLYYNTFRYYDADSGRFTTEDPIGLNGGDNLYQYAPNPLMWIDPWGWACGHTQVSNAKVKDLQSGKSVTARSFKEADQLLHKAFPNARKVRGGGNKSSAKTAKQQKDFSFRPGEKGKNAVYHKDYQYNSKGKIFGHPENGNPEHLLKPHVNILTPQGKKIDIIIER